MLPRVACQFFAARRRRLYAVRMNKRFMVEQLAARIRESAQVAMRERAAAAAEARAGASPDEKRADGRVALEYSNLARAQGLRAGNALDELAVLESFNPPPLAPRSPVSMGAIVEVEDGEEGRTIFLAPVGAGIELTMPDGDGFLTVVTPASPLGKVMLGRRVGDSIEVTVKGDLREWTVTYVG
jgi:transcription elongation GreA/GreB family factor